MKPEHPPTQEDHEAGLLNPTIIHVNLSEAVDKTDAINPPQRRASISNRIVPAQQALLPFPKKRSRKKLTSCQLRIWLSACLSWYIAILCCADSIAALAASIGIEAPWKTWPSWIENIKKPHQNAANAANASIVSSINTGSLASNWAGGNDSSVVIPPHAMPNDTTIDQIGPILDAKSSTTSITGSGNDPSAMQSSI